MRDQQQRAGEALQGGLERLAALEVQHVRAGVHEDRDRQPPALAAGEHLERLLCRLAAEQEAPEQRPRLVRLEPRRALAGLDHGPAAADLLRVLGEQAEADVVPAPQLAAVERALARERPDERRLAAAVRADERDVLAALQPQL